jgi:hypothetical protein
MSGWSYEMSRGPGHPWERSRDYEAVEQASRARREMMRLGWRVGHVERMLP